MIGQAVGDLGVRLAQATEQRADLTRRLLDIRSDERRALARELHDEFGQNLTGILAFASTIEASQRAGSGAGRACRAGRANDFGKPPCASWHACGIRSIPVAPSAPPRNSDWRPVLVSAFVDRWQSQQMRKRPVIQLDLQGDLADVRGIVCYHGRYRVTHR